MLSIGFESISRETLKSVHKHVNRPEQFAALVEKVHSYGIMVFGLFMFGFDGDDGTVFDDTVDFNIAAGYDACAYSTLTPYPGTLTWYEMKKANRIVSFDWTMYDQGHVVYRPAQMSPNELRVGGNAGLSEVLLGRLDGKPFPLAGPAAPRAMDDLQSFHAQRRADGERRIDRAFHGRARMLRPCRRFCRSSASGARPFSRRPMRWIRKRPTDPAGGIPRQTGNDRPHTAFESAKPAKGRKRILGRWEFFQANIFMVRDLIGRFGPQHPLLGTLGSATALPIAEWLFRARKIYRANSPLAAKRRRQLVDTLRRGEPAYLAGISMGGFHNSGVALVEVTPEGGPRIVCNNEEERFSAHKHANHYPQAALEALANTMEDRGIAPEKIVAWLATFDYPLYVAVGIRAVLEEFPGSMPLLSQSPDPGFDLDRFRDGFRAPARLARLFRLQNPVPIIGMPHHDNHAWFSYVVSPFARDLRPVMVIVVDGSGDGAAISKYVGSGGELKEVHNNASVFDSLGNFYSVISST